jgi:quercetin dioxygenase-like cupin family protein
VSPIDEIDFFLDGSLIYAHEGKSFTARKGDVVFFEKGEKISFVTEEGCSVFFCNVSPYAGNRPGIKKRTTGTNRVMLWKKRK